MKLVTLFTDASFDRARKIGSYAAWMKCDGRTERMCGVLRGDIDDAWLAEASAIANGLWLSYRLFGLQKGDRVIATSDCLNAMQAFGVGFKKTRMNESVKHIRELVLKLISDTGITVEYRHVKAHSNKDGVRSAVNRWCDSSAKAALRKHRVDKEAPHAGA